MCIALYPTAAYASSQILYIGYNDNHNNIGFKFDQSIEDAGLHDIAGHGAYSFDSNPYCEAYYRPSDSGVQINLKFYALSMSNKSYYAITYLYKGSSQITYGDYTTKSIPAASHADYAEILFNTYKFHNLSTDQKYETSAHEMGHVYGLHHDDFDKTTMKTIMYEYDWLYSRWPTSWDYSKITTLYN